MKYAPPQKKMEHGTLGLLGLSPSLLGGGTLGNPPHNMWTPQKPPAPGHSLVYQNPERKVLMLKKKRVALNYYSYPDPN